MERKMPSMERLQARTFKSTSKGDFGTKEKKKPTTNRKSRNQCNYIDLGEGQPRIEENLV